MASLAPLKVSYCVTCKKRLAQLKQTLPANMALEAGNDVEWVVLDYDCPEGTADWVKANFRPDIESGRVRLARHAPAPRFRMEHAKNMAARLATGDILCNVDADNFIAKDFSPWLVRTFTANPDTFVTTLLVTVRDKVLEQLRARLANTPRPTRDLGGRVAISRVNFERLGGYDEALVGGWDDVNFGVGARRLGLTILPLPAPYWGSFIAHDDLMRVEQLPEAHQAVQATRVTKSSMWHRLHSIRVVMGRRDPVVNAGAVGCGDVYLNFDDHPITIGKLSPAQPAAA